MKSKTKKGFVLSEVLLAIAVIIIIGITAYPVYQSSRDKAKVRAEVGTLVSITTNMDKFFSTLRNQHITPTNIQSLNVFPENVQYDSDGNALNLFNGTILISQDTQDAATTNYIIAYTNIPTQACIQIVQQSKTLFNTIYVGGNYPAGTYADGTQVYNNSPLNIGTLTGACESSSKVNISFLK